MRPARQQGRPARARVGAAARLLAAAVLSLGGVAAQASEQDERAPAARRPFARLIEDARGGRLELLVATYEKADAELTLFGCVHVADRAFYLDMQRRFRGLDALLYELIADPDVRPYPGMEVGEDEHHVHDHDADHRELDLHLVEEGADRAPPGQLPPGRPAGRARLRRAEPGGRRRHREGAARGAVRRNFALANPATAPGRDPHDLSLRAIFESISARRRTRTLVYVEGRAGQCCSAGLSVANASI